MNINYKMCIAETIMRYIDIYDGSEKRIIKRTVQSHMHEFKKEIDAINSVKSTLKWLVENGYIEIVSFQNMTDMQKRYYESDGFCSIYSIIKRFNESEYLKEKYSSN